MSEEDLDKEFNLLQMYIYDCITRICLNAYIDPTKVSYHPMYTYEEYKVAIFDPWTGEKVADRDRRVLNIKPLF